LQPLEQAWPLLLGQLLTASAPPLRFQAGDPFRQQRFQPLLDRRYRHAMVAGNLRRLVVPTESQQGHDPLDQPTVATFVGFAQAIHQLLDHFWANPYSYLHDRWLSAGFTPSPLPALRFFCYESSDPFSLHL
jgi:hypothetical protein